MGKTARLEGLEKRHDLMHFSHAQTVQHGNRYDAGRMRCRSKNGYSSVECRIGLKVEVKLDVGAGVFTGSRQGAVEDFIYSLQTNW